MAYLDTLPSTDLNAVDIRDTIGCPSNNLAHYCVRARSGGTTYGDISLAFNTVEVGGTPSDGGLISGATPYFNIYSLESPGEWYFDMIFKFRLRRNTYGTVTINGNTFDSSSYCYDLGAFREYVAAAAPPYIKSAAAISLITSSNLTIKAYRGHYPWNILAAEINPDINQTNLYVSLALSGATIGSTPILFSDWALIDSDVYNGIDTFTLDLSSQISTVYIYTNLFYKAAGSSTYQFVTVMPMEDTSYGNGEFSLVRMKEVTWTDYYKDPILYSVTFYTGDSRSTTSISSIIVDITTFTLSNNTLSFYMRVHPLTDIESPVGLRAELDYPMSYLGAAAGTVEISAILGRPGELVTAAEAEANVQLKENDETWIIYGSVSSGYFPVGTSTPYNISMHIFNTQV